MNLTQVGFIAEFIKWALPVHSLKDTFSLIENNIVEPTQGFLESHEHYLFECCNGCGSAQAKFDFVPDSIYRLCITAACHIHDFDYEHAYTLGEKLEADDRFKRNIHAIIDNDNAWWRSKDKMKAKFEFYYISVRKLGLEALEKKRFLHNQIAFNEAQGLPPDFNIDQKTLDWNELVNSIDE